MPTVSVIVPVYKVEKYIHRCVDSILGQTFSDFELILVDDGSPDNCGAICDEYAARDDRVCVLHLQNGGVSRARNMGLDIARGTYIAFCDSDDWWDTGLLEYTVTEMQRSNLDWISFRYRKITDSGNGNPVQYPEEVRCFLCWEDKLDYLFHYFLQCKSGWEVWMRVFRRQIIEHNHIRFCETCGNFAEDMGFCVKFLLCAQKVKATGECFYNYYQREQSMMAKSRDTVKFNELNEVSRDVALFAKTLMPTKTYKNCIGVMHYLIMNNQYSRLFFTEKYRTFPNELKKIQNKKWFRKATLHTVRNRKKMEQLFGKFAAVQIVNLSVFSLHRMWYPYMLIKRVTNWIMKKF